MSEEITKNTTEQIKQEPQKAAPQKAAKKAKFASNTERQTPPSRAEIKRDIELNSYLTQQVMQRSITKLPQYLFSLAVIMPAVADHNDENIIAALGSVDAKINNFIDDLDAALNQMDVLSKEWGIDSLATHSNPVRYSIAITTPHYGRMINAIIKLDRFFCLAETLYLNGVIQDVTEYWEHLKGWRARGNQTVSDIIAIENRARSAANRKGKTEAIEAATTGVANEGIISASDSNGVINELPNIAEPQGNAEVLAEQGVEVAGSHDNHEQKVAANG